MKCPVCNLQEKHIREVAQQYFEAEDDSSRAGQSSTPGETHGLPLVAGSNFMAKDVRMLLRESASMKACPLCHLCAVLNRQVSAQRFLYTSTHVHLSVDTEAASEENTSCWT